MSALFRTIRILSSCFLTVSFKTIHLDQRRKIRPDCLNCIFELVRDVQLVSVKQKDDSVRSLREPLQHPGEIVAPVDQLFLPGEDARGVEQSDALQSFRVRLGRLEPAEESSAKLLQVTERLRRINR